MSHGQRPGGGGRGTWSPFRPPSPYGPSPPPRLTGSPGMPMFAARVPYVPCPRPRWPVPFPPTLSPQPPISPFRPPAHLYSPTPHNVSKI